jgi:hypothetical protein
MRHLLLLLVVAMGWQQANAQFTDTFLDGNFTHNPTWTGDTSKFIVNTSGQLQLATSGSGMAALSTASTVLDEAEWQFFVRLAFAPSNTNQARIYLAADNSNLSDPLNGYFIRLGETGDRDGIDLYRQSGTTETRLLTAFPGWAASNPSLRIKVSRSKAGLWTIFADSTGGTHFMHGGQVNDIMHRNTQYFGVQCRYTTTNASRFFFDDVEVSSTYRDITPPLLLEAIATSAYETVLTFSEPVAAQAHQLSHYLLNENIRPSSAQRAATDPAQVKLTWDQALQDKHLNRLRITHIPDLAGNVLLDTTARFTWQAPYEPGYRDVVINEFMADESPVVGLPQAEFAELYNTTGHALNLAGFTFGTDKKSVTLPSYILPPGGYVLICASSKVNDFRPYGAVLGLAIPAFLNGGDTWTLRDAAGKLMDQVSYDISWYGDAFKANGGWALEQINPYTKCTGPANWTASIDVKGGTPAAANSVLDLQPDTVLPQVSRLVLHENIAEVFFSKRMDSLLLLQGNYQFSGDLALQSVEVSGPEANIVRLLLNKAPEAGKLYSLSLQGLKDCPGLSLKDTTLQFGIGSIPGYHEIVINEIHARPGTQTSLPNAEFIELYNPTTKLLDLQGCTYSDGSTTVVLPSILIPPGQYLILCPSNAQTSYLPYGLARSLPRWISLTIAGKRLTLRSPVGHLLHTVHYSDSWYGDAVKKNGGWTLEMIDPANACAGSSNWTASLAHAGGTPGRRNSVKATNPDLTPPVLKEAIALSPTLLRLRFSESLDSSSALRGQYSLSGGIAIQRAEVRSLDFNHVYLYLTASLRSSTAYTLTASNLTDCSGNMLTNASVKVILPEPAQPGDVVINEVLFNAPTGGATFVELHNISPRAINLQHWHLGNLQQGTPSNFRLISQEPFLLLPGQYVALTTNPESIKAHYPRARTEALLQVASLPSLPNSSGSVVLQTAAHFIMDQFEYSEKMHLPLIREKKGVSLERIAASAPSGDPHNWQSAAADAGYATPGYTNSQKLNSAELKAAITVYPKVFTPDEDGQADFTTIQYQFEKGGSLATLKVFDEMGRQIKTIATNQPVGTEGFFRWDGTHDNGQKAKVGYYLVLVEIFTTTGATQRFKESVVLGARF